MSTIREKISQKAAVQRVPIMAAFELLPLCNLQCKMCYVRKTMPQVQKAGGIKDASWWLSIAEKAQQLGLLYPLLTGGEPFLHPQFFEILSGMRRMGLQPSINSNGTLLDREKVIRLKECPPVRVNVTLYGASEETYQRLCGDGKAYGRVVQAVSLLKEYGIPVKLNTSLTPDNVDELEKIIAFAKEAECPIQVATYMFPPIRRDETMIGRNARLEPERAALARVTADYMQKEPEWFAAQALRYQSFVPLEEIEALGKQEKKLGMHCRAGVSSFWIDWQGNLCNCGMYPSVTVSMQEKTFSEAWKELVRQNEAVSLVSPCAGCPNEKLCRPCVAMLKNECGAEQKRPEYVCRMKQEEARRYQEFTRREICQNA